MQITGKLIYLDPTKDASKTEGKQFLVRTLGIETSDEVNGRVYLGYIGFQATGDKCDKFDNLNIGDIIEITYSINGTLKESTTVQGTEKNPKSLVIFTNLTAYGVKLITPASSSSASTPAPATQEGEDKLPF